MNEDTLHKPEPWSSRLKLVFIAFALIGGFFLIAEHQAHVLPYLPWLFLGGCFFMHMFMHKGHGHGGHRMDTPGADGTRRPSAPEAGSQASAAEGGSAPAGNRSSDRNESSATTPPVDHSHHRGERPS